MLNAIIELFAIVAKEDDVTESERDQIASFLKENLNEATAKSYLNKFDEIAEVLVAQDRESGNSNELEEVREICRRINFDLSYRQKIILIQQLVMLILADGYISEQEDVLVKEIGASFKVPEVEINQLISFAQGNTTEELKSEEVLLISANQNTNGQLHINRPNIKGFASVLMLQSAQFYFIKYLGNTNLYLNGVPLRTGTIKPLPVGSALRSDKMKPVYYSDIASRFQRSQGDNAISFQAKNVTYKFRNGAIGLRDINISEESGSLVGLMGASGAGKSTLLSVLNGNEAPADGTVEINGIDIYSKNSDIEGIIGYVPQDDLLIEELSVYQNLFYAAKLCFSNLNEAGIDDLVIKTLTSLGLLEAKSLKVGSPLEKTISGGQRKRLNIGLELLREPAILFVDEPTSGLSSRDSENIMDLLKELSLKGKLIFVVIHQPSSDIFKMFDKMVILDVGGYQIFYGNPLEAVTYFKEIIELINSEQGECIECGNVNPEQIFNIIETKVMDEYGRFTTERKITPQQWHQFYQERISLPEIKSVQGLPEKSLTIPNFFKQLRIFTTRDLLSKISNRQYMLINLLEAPLLAFILAYIVKFSGKMEGSEYIFAKNVNIPAYIFMSIIVALFMGLTVSAEEIIKDRKILKREQFLNLSRSSYLFSKLLLLFSISAVQTLLFVLIGNFILEIKDMTLTYWLVLFSTSCLANLLGLNISSAFNSAVTIYILIPILLIPQLLLSGVVVSFDNLNPTLSSANKVPLVGEFMASRWAMEATIVDQYKNNRFQAIFYDYDRTMGNADYKKTYYIPALLSKLDYNRNHIDDTLADAIVTMNANFALLRNEISKELKVVGGDKFNKTEQLTVATFNEDLYKETSEFLEILRRFYSIRFNKANGAKDKIIREMVSSPEKQLAYENLRNLYQNERIEDVVKNVGQAERIIEEDGGLVQKIYPIFMTPDRSNAFKFRSQFYVPEKSVFGNVYDTLTFNLIVIWIMSIILYFTLYVDLLRKVLEFAGNLKFTARSA